MIRDTAFFKLIWTLRRRHETIKSTIRFINLDDVTIRLFSINELTLV